MKIAILADPHIGSQNDIFVENWKAAVKTVNGCDDVGLAIVLGDLTLDGANLEADLAFGAAELKEITAPVLVLPGNHDVGDIASDSVQPANEARLAAWEKHFGAWAWHSDAAEGWRLIGLNSQIIGSGLLAEEQQWAALERMLTERGNRKPVLFLHMPLFLEDWNEADRPAWALKTQDRLRLQRLIAEHGVFAVISGHMHRTLHLRQKDEPVLIWTPASSFLARDESMPSQPGKELLGVTLLDFGKDDISVEFMAIDGLMKSYIEDYKGSIYRSPAKTA
ncbi:metallophosphoesterase [Agrobacterium vitis]|uniref:Metallophosphoesterase n=1 Tax=Agrobacterium vitis TaxID=373 RepID=A0A109CUD2_AGRVI|nr:metallophosphoesterase [Agrobacterium vitis]KAA3506518.1 metallophosphoesterase [Agrobacterium vitis]KAA3520986.1 metallophosphoesterase [Agrobacterium vitis]MCF1479785.1 metallophosphoesterase [Agrobacterium vitis]MUO80812.1 metallophosphoesterase [Agrobacterium vitis]MUO94720.1 metallophosphoesterase [Agrobacterium vitis]